MKLPDPLLRVSLLRVSLLHVALLASCITVVACQGPGEFRKPSTPLERGLYFSEVDSNGHTHGVSRATDKLKKDPLAIERVAWGQDVDANSQLPIQLLKDALKPSATTSALPPSIDDLSARAAKTKQLLDAFTAYVASRASTLAAWEALRALPEEAREDSAQDVAFVASRNSLNASWQALSATIAELWPATGATAARAQQIDDLLTQWRIQGDGSGFQAFLQAEIDALQQAAENSVGEVRQRALHLRIEAFLVPGEEGKDPVAIHVPGYDKLDSKRVESIDRFGLSLSQREREALAQAIGAVRETAEAAEKVRQGEASLSEAFRAARSSQVAKLAHCIDEFEGLRAAWEQADERAQRTRSALAEFRLQLKTSVAERLPDERRALEESLAASFEAFLAETQGIDGVFALIDDVRRAKELWERATWRELPEAYVLASKLAADAEAVHDSRAELLTSVETLSVDARTRIETWAAGGASEVKTLALSTFERSELNVEIDAWRRLAHRTLDDAKAVKDVAETLLGLKRLEPLPGSIRVPDPLDPLLEDARDTFIDLSTVDRKAGDRVEVRASLVEGGEAFESSSFSFDVKKLGWHADPVPAVVLVTADQLAGADDSGGFSASLSWMLRYGPRNDEDDFLAKSARVLGWGVGMHATLLNFDASNDAEIGLGVTFGFWNDLLLFGAGFNPLADDARDGRVYYFIGSSLIPLLQAMD